MIKIKDQKVIQELLVKELKTVFRDVEFKHINGQVAPILCRPPTLCEQYLFDAVYIGCTSDDYYTRDVHPEEAEGYEDISELDDYITVLSRLEPWFICKKSDVNAILKNKTAQPMSAKDMIDQIVSIDPIRLTSRPGFQFVDPITLEPIDHVDIKGAVKLKEQK